jgi:signal transduction histidine kinase
MPNHSFYENTLWAQIKTVGAPVHKKQFAIRVLLVEDNPGDADLTEHWLSKSRDATFEFICVGTSLEALKWLSRNHCDVIILDLDLPDSTGLETINKIRSAHPNTPTIVVSGLVDEQLREEGFRLGVEEIIPKVQLHSNLFCMAVLFIVERNRAREQGRQLAKILDTTPDAVVVVNRAGKVKYVNNQALTFFGMEREELLQECLLFSAPEGGTTELRVPRVTGDKVGEMRVVEFEWQGERSFLASIRDVTEQKNMEMQLLMSDRLASLGTLSAGIAHEINNPLAAVLGNVEFALLGLSKMGARSEFKEIEESLQDTHAASTQIQQIVQDVKLFSRSEAEDCKAVDVHTILDSVARMASNEVRATASLKKEYGQILPVYANGSRLSQVFLNLIVNAAQAIPPGNREKNEVRISTQMYSNNRVAVYIKDTGAGIPLDVQRRMFTPFFTTKPVGKGTGLGLAISQRIINAMGGEISFESHPGKGTCFCILLPIMTSTVIQNQPKPQLPPPNQVQPRVLIIDDDEIVSKSIKRCLAKGYHVTCLTDATKALEVIKAGERFDAILCDLMMYIMTGMEFCKNLEILNPEQATKLIFMTGGTQEFPEIKNYRQIPKPFSIQKLISLINENTRS